MPKILLLCSLFLAASIAPALWADTPLPPPKVKEIWSPNKHFSAVMDPQSKTTTVSRIEGGGRPVRLWSMKGWFRVAHLADDGEHLVCGHDGMNLLPLNITKDEPMIRFFKKGKLIKTVVLGELIDDMASLKRTASHFLWGSYLGFDAKGRYVVTTVEGNKLVFDPATGNRIAAEEESDHPKDNNVQRLTEADNGRTVKIAAGRPFDVVLRGNPTTGFSWAVEKIDGDAVRQHGKAEYAVDKHPEGMVGVGGAFTFHFDVKKPAKTKIRLVYRRPWEKDIKPAETFEVVIDSR